MTDARSAGVAGRIVVAGLIAAGAVIRGWMLASAMGALEGDEAVVGLMARAVTHGQVVTFFWGQAYGGSLEAILAAPVLAIWPTTVVGLKLVGVGLNAVAALLVWRIAIRMVGRRAGALAGALFWAWPASFVWLSADMKGFYQSVMVCGLAVVLLGLQVIDRPEVWWRWAGLGLAAGVGWWQAPQIAFFVVPTGLWMLWNLARPSTVRPLVLGSAWAALGAVVGAGPWLVFNLRNSWLSFDARWAAGQGSYLDHLETFATRGLPMALGTRVVFSGRWIGGDAGRVAYGGLLVALVVLLVWRRPRSTRDPIVLVLLAAIGYPLLLAAFPNSWYVGEGRYLYFLAPWVAIAFGLAGRRAGVAAVVAIAAVASSVSSLYAVRDETAPVTKGLVHVPVELGGVISLLEAEGYTGAYADYWIAYRLRYQSDDAVLGVPTYVSRDPGGEAAVTSMERVGWVVADGGSDLAPVLCTFDALGVSYRRVDRDGYVVLLPTEPVTPAQVASTCPAPGIY